MAVTVVVRHFGSVGRKLAVAMDSEYVYSGLQGAAVKWQQNGWVSSAGPVSNVDLWIQLLSPIELSSSVYGLRGNDVADELANRGQLQSSLYCTIQINAQVGLAIHTPIPPGCRSMYIHYPEKHNQRHPSRGRDQCQPFDTPGRNLFSAQHAGPLYDEMEDDVWPDRGPVALKFSNSEYKSNSSFSSVDSVLVSNLSSGRSTPIRNDSHNYSDCSTLSWCGTDI